MTTRAPRPLVTVAVAGGHHADALPRTLDSLAVQTLPAEHVEVVVVAEPRSSRAVAPAVPVRWLELASSPLGIRTAALNMARADHTTFLEAGDTVSPGFLETLLARVQDATLACAPVVHPGTAGPSDVRRWAASAGTVTDDPGDPAIDLALGSLVGAMLPTAFGRAVAAEHGSINVTGEAADETVFLGLLLSRFGIAVSCCAVGEDAVCVRAERPVPADEHRRLTVADLAVVRHLTTSDVLLDSDLTLRAVEARLDAINLRLRRDPGLHDATVELIRGEPATPVDWARVNRDVARDLAVVYAALPYVDTAGNMAARRVRALGRPVDVVCADMSRLAPLDPSASALWREYLGDRHELGGPATMHGDWPAIARFCREGARAIATAEALKGPYRSVYSRTMFPAAHLLAALYKHDHPETPWVAEFSDPQLRDSLGGTRPSRGEPDHAVLTALSAALADRGFVPPEAANVWEWVELVAYAMADTVMFTNANQLDYMLGYCRELGYDTYADRAAAHAEVLAHPQPPPELYRTPLEPLDLNPEFVHIGYFGTFYAARTLTEVVAALRELDDGLRRRLRLHVFTKKPDVLRAEAVEAGVGDVVVAGGYLDFTHYLAMTTRLDVLLVNDYATRDRHARNPYLPAKYADYAGSGRPVWGVVEPGSVLSTEPLSFHSEVGDVAGARHVLERIAMLKDGASGAGVAI